MYCEFGSSVGLGVAIGIVDIESVDARRHLGSDLKSDSSILLVGALCVMGGLKNKPEWNGKNCRIERYAVSSLSCRHIYLTHHP